MLKCKANLNIGSKNEMLGQVDQKPELVLRKSLKERKRKAIG